ncbi:hypothetical protein [Clostridium sp.]|uniref:hypothetical protein n=1 Tax=Clostridium sp. TaxID=1506 RepID=UPI003F4C7413
MSVISNVAILQNPQNKKAFSKLSFETGEKFSARILSIDSQKGEVNLKLLDGWQFSAKLDKPLEQGNSSSVLKFVVEGFEDGKLKIKLVYEDKQGKLPESNILDEFTSGSSLVHDKMDAIIFEKMIKHDMPLTKDNIIDIKNLLDFKEKISLNTEKEDVFIAKYLDSRNIDPASEKANETTKILKNFFQALKNLDIDEILLFKENNIELTKGNLVSIAKLFKGESAIYNNLKDINDYILNSDALGDIGPESLNQKVSSVIGMDKTQLLDNANDNSNLKDEVNIKELVSLINKELKGIGINQRVLSSTVKNLESNKNLEPDKSLNAYKNLKSGENIKLDINLKEQEVSFNSGTIKILVDKILKAQQILISPDNQAKLVDNVEGKLKITQLRPESLDLEIAQESEKLTNQNEKLPPNKLQNAMTSEAELASRSAVSNKTNAYGKSNSLNEIINMIKKELSVLEVDRSVINDIENNIDKVATDSLIKEQIKVKTEEIKEIVRGIIDNKLNLKPESYEKVMDVFSQTINDIKVFNSISEQYYYLDLPINVKDDEYECKIIIKDDRKKGKKIDSKNVKIATRVKTINMGSVDAYIKINNNNMNIAINCDNLWVNVLDLGKEKLIRDLSSLNYRVSIDVDKKANEFTLANCREFFDDRSFNTLDIKV